MAEAGGTSVNTKGACLAAAIAVVAAIMLLPEQALAFTEAGGTIVAKTNEAIKVAQKILVTAAVLALIIGIAPMLWGQIKVKWIISSLVMCVVIGLVQTVVQAFAS